MLGLQYVKASPSTYLMQVRNGRTVRQGAGLAFWYFMPRSSLVAVPLGAVEAPCLCKLITADYQEVQVQAQITYRIARPEQAAARLDFTVSPDGRSHLGTDVLQLPQRIELLAQSKIRALVQGLELEAALVSADAIAAKTRAALRQSETLVELGIEVLDFAVIGIRPSPDTSRALEAATREAILKRADDALYERRNAAIEQERRIKESELDTDLAVQAKQREVREAQLELERIEQLRREAMAAQALEAQVKAEARKRDLVALSVENVKQEAEANLYATRTLLQEVGRLDPRVLQALAVSGGDPKMAFAQAFQTLAENAGRIGEINFTPDLLGQFVGRAGARA